MLLRFVIQLIILMISLIDIIDVNLYIIYTLSIIFIMQWLILKPVLSKPKEFHLINLYKVYRQMELRRLMLVGDISFIAIATYEVVSLFIYLIN